MHDQLRDHFTLLGEQVGERLQHSCTDYSAGRGIELRQCRGSALEHEPVHCTHQAQSLGSGQQSVPARGVVGCHDVPYRPATFDVCGCVVEQVAVQR